MTSSISPTRPMSSCSTPWSNTHPHRATLCRHTEGHSAGPSDRRGPRDSVNPFGSCAATVAKLHWRCRLSCAPKPPDYQSILSTTPTTSTTTPTAKPVPCRSICKASELPGQPVAPGDVPDLRVSIPTPQGWAPFDQPEHHPANADHLQGRRIPDGKAGGVPARTEISTSPSHQARQRRCATVRELQAAGRLGAPFSGFPSSMIQGSYDLDGMRLHSWNRIVMPTGPPPAKCVSGAADHHQLGQPGRRGVDGYRDDHSRIRRCRQIVLSRKMQLATRFSSSTVGELALSRHS